MPFFCLKSAMVQALLPTNTSGVLTSSSGSASRNFHIRRNHIAVSHACSQFAAINHNHAQVMPCLHKSRSNPPAASAPAPDALRNHTTLQHKAEEYIRIFSEKPSSGFLSSPLQPFSDYSCNYPFRPLAETVNLQQFKNQYPKSPDHAS